MSHAVIHADALTYLRGNRWLVQNGFIPKAHAILCDPPYAGSQHFWTVVPNRPLAARCKVRP